MLTKIMYATLFVSDQGKALDFYTNAFGFQKRADFDGPGGRFLTIALPDLGLEVLLWPGAVGQGKATSEAPTISVPGPLIIESDDLRTDFAELKRAASSSPRWSRRSIRSATGSLCGRRGNSVHATGGSTA